MFWQVVGVIVIGCICGAGVRFGGVALHNWAWSVRAEGQIGLVVLASLLCLGTAALLLTLAPIGPLPSPPLSSGKKGRLAG